MILYSRPKLADFYTLFESKVAENHTIHSGTYPYSLYMGVPPPGNAVRFENTSSAKYSTSRPERRSSTPKKKFMNISTRDLKNKSLWIITAVYIVHVNLLPKDPESSPQREAIHSQSLRLVILAAFSAKRWTFLQQNSKQNCTFGRRNCIPRVGKRSRHLRGRSPSLPGSFGIDGEN